MQNLIHWMTARNTGLIMLLVVAVCGVTSRHARAGTLDVDVFAPPLPVTEADIVSLRALTSDQILPSGSWQTITTNLEITGFDIQWDLLSNDTGLAGVTSLMAAGKLEDVGPLPAGTYTVTATWAMYGFTYVGVPTQNELDFVLLQPPMEGPRVGTYQFTVVPEPATLSLAAASLCMLGTRRRH